MTPTFNPGPNPLGRRSTSARARAAAHAGRRRGRRRTAGDAVRIGPVPAGGHHAGGARGLAAAGRSPADFAVVPEVIVSAEEDHAATRRLLAFYGSTRPTARCWISTAGASCSRGSTPCPSRAVGADGRPGQRRDADDDRRVRTRRRSPHRSGARRGRRGAKAVCLYQPDRSRSTCWRRSSTPWPDLPGSIAPCVKPFTPRDWRRRKANSTAGLRTISDSHDHFGVSGPNR